MIINLGELHEEIVQDYSKHHESIDTYFIVRGLIAIAERLPQDTEIRERLRAIVANNKCSDYKEPSELEAAIMALSDELEGA